MLLVNEEEIRGKVILPFLHDLGFDLSEVFMETSFSIRLGKTKKKIGGRSDILCKRNGRNLFIIELKSDSVTITQNDIDQGISYARCLMGDIAPFTIITNGKSTRIFDSVSRKELTGRNISECSDFWKNNYKLSTEEELRLRYEGLKSFISFSGDNLKLYCETQVKDRMGPIVGTSVEHNAKFVKELYIQREGLQVSFEDFLTSEATCFAIIGVAGVGKTNTMCGLALNSLEENFVFFYNAALIHRSPLEHIAQDLNLVFSARTDSDVILKKLDELGRLLGKNVILFIDAIDESTGADLALELSEMALAARNLEKLKICVSCKSNIWAGILNHNGSFTHLYEELRKFHPSIPSVSNYPGFLLDDFTDNELTALIPIYQRVFDFRGNISVPVLKELKNGFFLRIFSEVYSGQLVPEKINDGALIQTYLNKSLERCQLDTHMAKRILGEIGLALVRYTGGEYYGFNDEGMEVDVLFSNLKFTLNDTIQEDLFARNILSREKKDDTFHISFYYSKIRDYIICFQTFKLDKLSDEEFYKLLDEFHVNYIGKSAIDFYLENTAGSHQHVFSKYVSDKALSYVQLYDAYLNKHFKNSKHVFDPYTDGKIGIILPPNSLTGGGYALFPLQPEENQRLKFDDLKTAFLGDPDQSRLFRMGVNTVHGSSFLLMNSNQQRMVEKDIFKQLKAALEKGKLNAYNSDSLMIEQVALIVYYYQRELGFLNKHQDYYFPRFELIYPIDLQDLQNRIYRFLAYEYYRHISYQTPRNVIEQQVEEAIRQNIKIPPLNIIGDFPPIEQLKKIVSLLQEKGYRVLQEHFLPYPDRSVEEARRLDYEQPTHDLKETRQRQFSDQQAKLYIECFFSSLEDAYKDFVEYHFPTINQELSFYKNSPHEFLFYQREPGFSKHVFYGLRRSSAGERKFQFKPFHSHEDAFERDEVYMMSGFHLNDLVHVHYSNRMKTYDGLNTSKIDDFCVLRAWVYKLLRSDMEKFFRSKKI